MAFFKSVDKHGEEMYNGGVWANVLVNPPATGNIGILPRWEYNTVTGDKFFIDAQGRSELIQSAATTVFKNLNEWHVDISGSDTTGTGAQEKPYRTVAKAVTSAGQGDQIIVHAGVYSESVTITTPNVSLVGAQGDTHSVIQIVTVNFNAAGTSNKISDLKVTNLFHSNTAPLYVQNVSIAEEFGSSGAGYVEMRNVSVQNYAEKSAGTIQVENTKVGTFNITGANTVGSFIDCYQDATTSISFGAGTFYNIHNVSGGGLSIDPAAIPVETAGALQGLTAEQAKQLETSTFLKLGLLRPDAQASPTKWVTYNEITKRLEISDLTVDVSGNGQLLAAANCVGNTPRVRTNFDTTKIFYIGGDFASINDAMASPFVTDNTLLIYATNYAGSSTQTITKSVIIDLAGNEHAEGTAATVFDIQASNVVIKNGTIRHTKLTNTSVETCINISAGATRTHIENITFYAMEFAITAKGSYNILNCDFNYQGFGANSHRFIGIYSVERESRIDGNTFTAQSKIGTTRYTNFILMTTSGASSFDSPLYITNNTQLGGDLRQFFLQEAGTATTTDAKLFFHGNNFNDYNGGIGFFTPALFEAWNKISVTSNVQGGDAAGNFKGLLYVDDGAGTGGSINPSKVEHAGNITLAGTLRADYVTMSSTEDNLITRKNTITALNDPSAEASLAYTLEQTGLLLQQLKAKRTEIVTPEGEFITWNGSAWVLPATDSVVGTSVTVGIAAPTGTSTEGAVHVVTNDGTPTGTVTESYVFDADSSTWIELNRNAESLLKFGTNAPTSNGDWDGEEFFVTSNGASSGQVYEQYVWDKQTTTWVKRPTTNEIIITSMTPLVYQGSSYVNAQADIFANCADVVRLSDNSLVKWGKYTFPSHGFTPGNYLYLSQTTAGQLTTTAPIVGTIQQSIGFVHDANTIEILVQEAYVRGTEIAPTLITKIVSPLQEITTPDGLLKIRINNSGNRCLNFALTSGSKSIVWNAQEWYGSTGNLGHNVGTATLNTSYSAPYTCGMFNTAGQEMWMSMTFSDGSAAYRFTQQIITLNALYRVTIEKLL